MLPKTLEMIDEDNSIVETYGFPICYCICPAELKPGETMPAEISRVALKQRFSNLETTGPVSYRIRYDLYLDQAFGDEPVPPGQSRSNTFTITGFEE